MAISPPLGDEGHFHREAWQVFLRLLQHFDHYQLATWVPVAAEIEIALNAAYAQGWREAGGQ
jgi:hypothetical protein